MAWGVNSVMSMGVGALFASQANIQTTGNNIANVNTPGYSRQAVVLTERYSLDYNPGQVGQGVNAKEVIRYFDKFIEKNYLSKLGTSSRYTTAYNQMRTVEEMFNEANVDGVGAATNDFFAAWNKLVQNPDDLAAREALLAKAGILTDGLNILDRALLDIEEQLNAMIRQEVDAANQLMKEIAALNKEISTSYLKGVNNPNQLMDERDRKVRELGAIIDVTVQDEGPGRYRVTMANGTVLVQDEVPFSLALQGPGVQNNLTADSAYKGLNANGSQRTAHFNGIDSREYTVEIVDAGAVGAGATFRVSVDGGKTWLKDDNGNDMLFNANEESDAVLVGDLEIHFDAGNLSAGDKFVISPKTDVYWISPTSGPMNVSTQIYPDGSDNSLRITGGTLGGYLQVRDHMIGEYRDRLDAFAESLVWEVNRIHSQGSGLEAFGSMYGTYAVGNVNAALGSPEARFTWAERLQAGNLTFKVYDAEGHQVTTPEGLDVLSVMDNFDPSVHSLQDVVNALNDPGNPISNYMSAQIVDGKLQINAKNDPLTGQAYTFAIAADTTGLTAALGINTFFTGDSAGSIAVRGDLFTNVNLINAGRLDGQGDINTGDNQTAREIAALSAKAVSVGTTWNKNTSQSLAEYYGGIITKVGSDTQSVKFTAATESSMAQDLYVRQEEISGVNLDEEMSNLIKFQASYKAAAKLITTADEMLQTLLSLKQ